MNDASWDGADVGAPVAPDLRLVAHAADRDPDELATEGAGDRLAERRLADARRPNEAQDRPLRVGIQRPHREVLEDPLLDRLEIVVVAIEDFARGLEIEAVLRHAAPREGREHIEVGAGDLVLGGLRRHLPEPLQLAVGHLLPLRGELRLLETVRELLELVVPLPFPQLLADHLELLAQHVLALILVEAGLHLFLDLRADLEHLQLLHEKLAEPLEPPRHVVDREQLRLRRQREIEVGGDEVRQLARLGDADEHFVQLGAEVGRDVDHARELRDDGALQRFGARVLEQVLDEGLAAGHQPLLALRDVVQPGALEPLHHDAHRAVAQLQHPHDRAERADVVELVRQRVHHGALGRLHPAHRPHDTEQQALLALDDLVDQLNGFGIGESQRQDDVGIDNELAQGKDRQAFH